MKEYVHNWDSIENANSHLSQYLFFSQALKKVRYIFLFKLGICVWEWDLAKSQVYYSKEQRIV